MEQASDTAGTVTTETPSAVSSQSPLVEFTRDLDDILRARSDGSIRFGAQNEPLRLSQVEILQAVKGCIEGGETLMHGVMPGGSGKTRVGIVLAHTMHRRKRRSLYVVPSQGAVEDFAGKAETLCPDLGVGAVYARQKRIEAMTFTTYASLLRRILGESAEEEVREYEALHESAGDSDRPERNGNGLVIDPADYDLVIWDEAHNYLTRSAQQLVRRFRHAINFGLTATARYYRGKEAANVFGKKAYELDLATAKTRQEISKYHNFLLTTDITTGLHLSSPDYEESAAVAEAIDLPARNAIFPEVYKTGKITIEGKEYTLAGEPMIVFGAGIDHVHDLANTFNDMLIPALRGDERFRETLRGKGINPDDVETVAVAVHSKGNDRVEPLDIDARNALIKRYDERKILVLVATSVLQQSFDSPKTSVVLDTVPRQTYVGVGQAGMRALRYRADKDMAFIINTEDADHPSLTFTDFEAARGSEEGVAIEIGRTTESPHPATETVDPASPSPRPAREIPASNYRVRYGAELMELSQRRLLDWNQPQKGTYLPRYLTPQERLSMNECILDIAGGNEEALRKFIDMADAWKQSVLRRLGMRVFHRNVNGDDVLEGEATELFVQLLGHVRKGAIQSWARFSNRFQVELRCRLERIRKERSKHLVGHAKPTKYFERMETHDPETARLEELTVACQTALNAFDEGKREILRRRLDEETLEAIADSRGLTRERVRQIYMKILRILRESAAEQPAIREWLEERTRALPQVEHMERMKAEDKQRKRNNAILWDIEEDLVTQKQCIRSAMHFRTAALAQRYPEGYLNALIDVEWTRIDDLHRALYSPLTNDLYARLPSLGIPEEEVAAVKTAIEELHGLMERFADMGGKPLY